MNKLAAEFIGTFALVFAGTGAVVINEISGGAVTHVGIAITFGLVVLAMIYAIGDVSGAHLNPAVTLGFFMAGRFPGKSVLPYMLSQTAGAFAASGSMRSIFGNVAHLGTTLPAGLPMQSFALEILLTAFLVFVILSVATGSKEQGLMAGIAIGATLGLDAMFGGPISGGSMNPARSLAPAVVSGNLASLWVYLTAPMIGAAVAVGCWRATRRQGQAAPASSTNAQDGNEGQPRLKAA
jgi:aquaporin Z